MKALVRVPRCKTEEEHKRAWQAVAAHFENVQGLKIDKSTKDSPRLCYVSYDPKAWIRDTPAAVLPFLPESAEASPAKALPKAKPPTRTLSPRKRVLNERQWTADEVADMLNAIPARPEYPEWMKISSAVWDELGEDGTRLLMEWSPEEEPGEYAEKFCTRLSTVGIGSLIHIATENSWQRPPDSGTRPRLDFSNREDSSTGFPITQADDIGGIAEPLDFVEDLLTDGGASVVYGPSNCGKSFWILDLAVSVSTGEPFRGELETDQGAVVYVALEGASGVRNRIEALRKSGRLPKDAPLFLCFSPVSLMDAGHAQQLAESVKQAAEKGGVPCRLVILDTLARAMAGGDENSGKDMTEAMKQIDAIRGATGAHVCVVHHCGKDENRGARGHSSLRAAVDTEIEITRPDGTFVSVVPVKKQRDLIARGGMAFHLQPIELGTGRRGKPITSCLVAHESDFAEPIKKAGRTPKATDSAFLALLPQPSTTAWKEAAMKEIKVGETAFFRVLRKFKSSGMAIPTKNDGWERKSEFRK